MSHRHAATSQVNATYYTLLSPSPRRPSVPSIPHQSSDASLTASSTLIDPSEGSIANSSTSDEIYRDLSTYTFGAARPPAPSPSPSYDADVEFDKAISPLTPLPRRGSLDRTPRSSVVAMSHGHGSHPMQTLQSHGNERLPTVPLRYVPWDLDGASTLASSVRNGESSDAQDSDDIHACSEFTRNHEISRTHFRLQEPKGDSVQSDTASRHTFGGRGINSSSASVSSVTSASRPHSPSSSRMELSSDEDNGYMYRAGRTSLPAYPRQDTSDAVDDEEEIDVGLGHAPPLQDPFGRRGSLPLPIPGAVLADRSLLGDDSNLASNRRPSRSLDDDMNLHTLADPPITIGPRSEPSSKGDWANLQFQNQEPGAAGPDPFAGLNLGYILGGQDVSGFRRASDAPSYVQPIRKGSQNNQIFPFSLGLGRRSSTATTISGPEDTFLRHLNKYNEGYGTQISFWTFKKEKADGSSRPLSGSNTFSSPRASISESWTLASDSRSKGKEKSPYLGMAPGTQEIWKCEYVGRFKVDRQTYRRMCIIPDVCAVILILMFRS